MANSAANDCITATCPVERAWLSAGSSLEGAVFMLAAFAVLVPINLLVGARFQITVYSLALTMGFLLEVLGYVGMLLLRNDSANKFFLLFLLGNVTGPTFMAAAIYTILPHILALYGGDFAIVPNPIWLTYFFLTSDIFTLLFQTVGCAFAAERLGKIKASSRVFDHGFQPSDIELEC